MQNKPTNHVDVIIVLGHKNKPTVTENAGLIRRMNRAFMLHHASELLLCGGRTGSSETEADAMENLALTANIAKSSITKEGHSKTTLENALFSKKIIQQKHWKTAIIVSDLYHLPRAWLVFRHLEIETTHYAGATPKLFSIDAVIWGLEALRELFALCFYLIKIPFHRKILQSR